MRAAELLRAAQALLLDFDGPLAALMPPPANARAADQARHPLQGVPLPPEIALTTDHLAVLRWAHSTLPGPLAVEVEHACTDAELEAAKRCLPHRHADALLTFAERRELPVGIVSNNSDRAVRAFMRRQGWLTRVGAYACRTPEVADRLKPRPDLLLAAADALGIDLDHALFVGDSVSDVLAGKAAGCTVLGMAKNDDRANELTAAGAQTVVPLGSDITVWLGA